MTSPGAARVRGLRNHEMAQGVDVAAASVSPAGANPGEDDEFENAAAGVVSRSAKGGDANNQNNSNNNKNFPGLFGACRTGSTPPPSPRRPEQQQNLLLGNGSVSLDHRRHSAEANVEGIGDDSRADRKGRTDESDGSGKGIEVEIMKHGASWNTGGGGRETNGSGAPPTPASSKTRLARCESISDDGDGNGGGPGRGSNEGGGRGPRSGSGVGGGIRRHFPRRTSLSPDDHFEDRENSRLQRGRQRELVEDRVGGGAGVWGSIVQSPGGNARGGGGGGGRTWSSIDKISKALRSSRRRGLRQVINGQELYGETSWGYHLRIHSFLLTFIRVY